MRKIERYLLLLVVCFLICGYPAQAAESSPAKDYVLPTLNLPTPPSPQERTYLGLSGGGHFRIPQIKADLVIVEIFSMYCPHCQKNAPLVNELYRAIENNPGFRNRIKLIGIGAGNSAYEVQVFQKTYNIPFPLIPDEDYTIHAALGEVRTPHFLGIRNYKNGTYQLFYSQVGGFEKAGDFLELMLKTSGLKEGGN